ncbi:endonuclease/exonuclease/phosphatase family protein [Streptomyces buecherae]|uniref:Endonuclease/exonuclease/phosphatase family protein n=1 Tax=Streptomyces buecherae TaxID=2763006 RepID=A0A7H8N2P8_9ACTN|nr:endonuclease/exonuclease/phosphatase family protein [Streptomyces buecherae]
MTDSPAVAPTAPTTPAEATGFSRRDGMRAAAAAALALPLTAGVAHAATPSASAAPATAAAPAGPVGSASQLRAMTFNLRYASDTRPNSWAERRPVTRTLLRRERPHLLGTQEGVYSQILDIAQDLGPRYDWIGTGREGGSRGEFMAVFYDTQRLAPLEYDHFWLSGTPYVIGSNTWGNAVVRMATWVRFRDLRSRGQFYALNTHFDHRNQRARERSADLIAERLRGLDPAVPRIVTGDFNVPAHQNPVYDTLLGSGGLVDTWDHAEERGKLYATFHGYRPLVPDGERIDWILTSPGIHTSYASINTFSLDGQFPSDHLPVQAQLEL